MSHELREGQELKEIWWSDDGYCTVGSNSVESITVREQTGQMSMVPWVEVVRKGVKSLYNCAFLEGVTVQTRRTPDG